MSFQIVNTVQVQDMINGEDVTIIDMRDPDSFAQGHINSAQAMASIDLDHFAKSHPKDQALVLYCYHGISSQSAANWFSQKGFTRVFSMEGGFEAWPQN